MKKNLLNKTFSMIAVAFLAMALTGAGLYVLYAAKQDVTKLIRVTGEKPEPRLSGVRLSRQHLLVFAFEDVLYEDSGSPWIARIYWSFKEFDRIDPPK